MTRDNILKKSIIFDQTSTLLHTFIITISMCVAVKVLADSSKTRQEFLLLLLLVVMDKLLKLRRYYCWSLHWKSKVTTKIWSNSWRSKEPSSGNWARSEWTNVCVLTFVGRNHSAWISERSLHSLLHVTWSRCATVVTPTKQNTIINFGLAFLCVLSISLFFFYFFETLSISLFIN